MSSTKETNLGTPTPTARAQPLSAYSTSRKLQINQNQYLLYLSGTTARQADGQVPPFGHNSENISMLEAQYRAKSSTSAVAAQTEIILGKLADTIREASLGAAGLESLVELTIFLVDLKRDYVDLNEAYRRIIEEAFLRSDKPLPARTCLQVSAMPPDSRTLVEIKGIAAVTVPLEDASQIH